MKRRFNGQFDALTKMGAPYCNSERFKPLAGAGKPLWEFKEHDHRLYCYRRTTGAAVLVVLFNGWVKDKEGKTEREVREIQKAKTIYQEFLEEYPARNINSTE